MRFTPPLLLLAAALLAALLPASAADFNVAPGFKVEELHHTTPNPEGSWVSLCVDGQGDLIASDQYGFLWRITPPPLGQNEGTKVEKLKINAGKAHGLLWAFNSLYFMGGEIDPANPATASRDSRSLWRAQSTKNDGVFDKLERLVTLETGGEHGPHALVLSPDGKQIYFCCGNHTPAPKFEKSLAPEIWQEDNLLPRMWDANGHARGILAPGGFIARCNPDGSGLELVSHSYRNGYDFAFNGNGELFTYDSDMEWDYGLPWYRPTRICHATSGSDFGWRSGSSNSPAYYEDSLPAVLDIGPGSPTGVIFGTGAKFPAKYQHALFAMDWSYGTLYALHLQPKGASYEATKEVFVSRNALPLSDLVVRPQDGALYLTAGGRKTESTLLRVTYVGTDSTAPVPPPPLTAAQKLRWQLESHHHSNDAEAVAVAWPYLDDEDRFIRFAARAAIEQQPVAQWQARALAETRPRALRDATIALARCATDKSLQAAMVDHLLTQSWAGLDVPSRLQWLRACSLVFTRTGDAAAPVAGKLIAALDSSFPTPDEMVNRELASLLIFLDSPTIVAKTVGLMYTAQDVPETTFDAEHLARGGGYGKVISDMQKVASHKQQIHYAFFLRFAKTGWTPALNDKYFAWYGPARTWKGGNSFAGFLRNARDEALARITEPTERERLLAMANASGEKPVELPRAQGPGAAYTLADFQGVTVEQLRRRNVAHGKQMFQAALCAQCHRYGTEGGGNGAGGPDLTGASARYSVADLVTAIVDPNKEVSDQYAFTEFTLKSGGTQLGRIAREDPKKLYLITSFLAPDAQTPLSKDLVKSQQASKVSPMIAGLLNSLNKEEALDLLGYLMTPP